MPKTKTLILWYGNVLHVLILNNVLVCKRVYSSSSSSALALPKPMRYFMS